jgi:hypothetical protein
MRYFKGRRTSGNDSISRNGEHPYKSDHLSLAFKAGNNVENPVAFAQNLKRDLDTVKFNNTP